MEVKLGFFLLSTQIRDPCLSSMSELIVVPVDMYNVGCRMDTPPDAARALISGKDCPLSQ